MRSKAYRDAIKQTGQFERLATKDLGSGTTHEDLRKNIARVVRESGSLTTTSHDLLGMGELFLIVPKVEVSSLFPRGPGPSPG